jgi:glycerophosphoryl diester phosphodiesterase
MTKIIAHRGASATERENTVEAFAAAAEQGADGIELDVRRSGDGELVVHHDPLYPDRRPVHEVDAAERPGHVPTLDEALDACGTLLVNIEIKNVRREAAFDAERTLAADVVAVVRRRDLVERVVVSSFDLRTVDRVRDLAPDVATGWLVRLGLRRSQLDRCARHGHRYLHPWDRSVTAALVAGARSRGLGLNVWTVDQPARIARLAAWGVDGIVTNVPQLALDVLDPAR